MEAKDTVMSTDELIEHGYKTRLAVLDAKKLVEEQAGISFEAGKEDMRLFMIEQHEIECALCKENQRLKTI